MGKKRMKMLIAMLLVASLLAVYPPGSSAATNDLSCQLIADQKTVTAGGTISYHILFHNVQSTALTDAWIRVHVPKGLEPGVTEGAAWDAAAGRLQWNFDSIPAGSAGVVHFDLDVLADVAGIAGAAYEISCQTGTDAALWLQSPAVTVELGTAMHQPFYQGFPNGYFHPEANQTRAETAATVARILNLTDAEARHSFSDVTAGHWAYEYIHKAANAGYMIGAEGGFRPDEPITRAEFVTLLLRMKGIDSVPLEAFADAESHWAKDAIGTAKALNYIDGVTGSEFAPDLPIDRPSAAKLMAISLLRGALMDGETAVIQHFPDVPPEHWAFPWVEEASMVAHESVQTGLVEQLKKYLPEQTEPF